MSEMNDGPASNHGDSAKPAAAGQASRAPYETPHVKRFGSVEDLTTAVSGSGGDGGTASMAGG